jgi:hypothetical protein
MRQLPTYVPLSTFSALKYTSQSIPLPFPLIHVHMGEVSYEESVRT